jgi:hypothetical protein
MKRLVAVSALAIAACGAAAVPAGAQEPHPRAQAALAQAKRAIAPVPAAQTPPELTPALIRLSQALPRLEGHQRRAASRILARPDEPGDPDEYSVDEAPASPACDENFCVHWVARSKDKPARADSNGTSDGDRIPDYVENVLATAATSFAAENTALGWAEPLGDGKRGGGPGVNRTDAYLLELDGGYFGYAAPDPGQGGVPHKHAYLVLDNNYAEFAEPGFTKLEALQVTFAHEYNHVLQFAYDSLEDLWMFEATATWMEEQVYPDVDDYLNYLSAFADSSRIPLTSNDATGLKIYGAAAWNHFLAPTEVRKAWENSDDAAQVRPRHLSVAAYDSALLGGGESPFRVLGANFINFATATAEWRAQSAMFPDAADQPDMKRTAKLELGPSRTVTLDHLSYLLAEVPTQLATEGLKLRVSAPEGTRTGIDLIGRDGSPTDGVVTSAPLKLRSGGRGSVRLSSGEYDRVTAVIVNADARVGGSGQYTRNDQHFRVKLVRAN